MRVHLVINQRQGVNNTKDNAPLIGSSLFHGDVRNARLRVGLSNF